MDILGIDIGGSGIKGAPVDTETGKLSAARCRLPNSEPGNARDRGGDDCPVGETLRLGRSHRLWFSCRGAPRPHAHRVECCTGLDRL